MTELERKALMGNKQAQKECTEKGFVLPCPCCGNDFIIFDTSEDDYDYGYGGFRCYNCDLGQGYNFKTREEALEKWNTRIVPPAGKCEDCDYSVDSQYPDSVVCCAYGCATSPDGFCNIFEPKDK